MSATPHVKRASTSRVSSADVISAVQIQEAPESKYGPCKIKIWHEWNSASGIKNHPINKMFRTYNEFVKLVFSQKAVYETNYKSNLPKLLKLARKLGLQLLKGQLAPQNLKSREQINFLKELIVKNWCRVINESN